MKNVHMHYIGVRDRGKEKVNDSKKYAKRSGTDAIRNRIQPSRTKRDITNITNSHDTKRTYGQPSKQLFPKRWPLSNQNRTKII